MGEKSTRGSSRLNRVYISVEGQTEEAFVKGVLAKHLLELNVHIIPIILSTKKLKRD